MYLSQINSSLRKRELAAITIQRAFCKYIKKVPVMDFLDLSDSDSLSESSVENFELKNPTNYSMASLSISRDVRKDSPTELNYSGQQYSRDLNRQRHRHTPEASDHKTFREPNQRSFSVPKYTTQRQTSKEDVHDTKQGLRFSERSHSAPRPHSDINYMVNRRVSFEKEEEEEEALRESPDKENQILTIKSIRSHTDANTQPPCISLCASERCE